VLFSVFVLPSGVIKNDKSEIEWFILVWQQELDYTQEQRNNAKKN